MKKFKINNPKKWRDYIVKEANYNIPNECRGGLCVDAGSNIGDFQINHKQRFDKYVCFEISQENIDEAIDNTKNLGLNIEYINKAVYSESGKTINVYAYNPPNSDNLDHFGNSGNVGIFEGTGKHGEGWKRENKIAEVETISLEDIISEYGTINLLKIDVEGAEYPFLLDKDLSKINFIVAEIHKDQSDIDNLVNYITRTHKLINKSGKFVFSFKIKNNE